ncbi:hypothetical protein ACIA58_01080 [Kribbella sp. NPDC051586]|uniref:hypothetical protein n=1 Tax=Kribbella sp. NPDC051586 TaxID=3364118 RepID=UPI0037ADFDCE
MASLVLHYLEDWTEPLAELRRVLRGRTPDPVGEPPDRVPGVEPRRRLLRRHRVLLRRRTRRPRRRGHANGPSAGSGRGAVRAN